jgi:2-methylcitrate dehydratase PrpD
MHPPVEAFVLSTQAAPAQELAGFLAAVRYEDLPPAVVARTVDLFLDWFACTLAGKGARPVRILENLAASMGPAGGPSEIITSRRSTSPLFAALVNAAASHVVEQDDLHNGSVLHPGTVVFPAVLAAAQETGASGRELIAAAVAGYEAGVRVGEFLGRSHYRVFHTTGTAGTLAAAAGVARVLKLDARQTQHCLGSAGTQAAGLWQFLRDAADSKQLHTAKAAANGLLSAYLARDGFTGASEILTGTQGMSAGMSSDADPTRLTDRLGVRWPILETSFKIHASCRHTHPAADALLQLMQEQRIDPEDISSVTAHVHQGALDVLGPVTDPQTIHHAKFSMGFVLALIALRGRAGLTDFSEATLRDPRLRAFHDTVRMVLDPDIDAAYPGRWMGRVTVTLRRGDRFEKRITSPAGDPDRPLSRADLDQKARRLAAFAGGASDDEMTAVLARIWGLPEEVHVRNFLLPAQ